jgi:hypothetical protein
MPASVPRPTPTFKGKRFLTPLRHTRRKRRKFIRRLRRFSQIEFDQEEILNAKARRRGELKTPFKGAPLRLGVLAPLRCDS